MQTALLVIDVQMAFVEDDANGAARSCREAERNIATLLAAFRERGATVIHIHHHGLAPDDPFHVNASGSAVQPFASPLDSEAVFVKHGGSGFVGTSLEEELHAAGVKQVVLCGATANHCVESTTRTAADLGFVTIYVSDAVWAYSATGPDGVAHDPEQVHSMTLSNLHGEFATVLKTNQASALAAADQ